jgi:hypothetical protein
MMEISRIVAKIYGPESGTAGLDDQNQITALLSSTGTGWSLHCWHSSPSAAERWQRCASAITL